MATSSLPPATTSVEPAHRTLAEEQRRLLEVHESLPRYALDPTEPGVLGNVTRLALEADLVFTGEVVRLDDETAYLEPGQVLKGTPLFGTPIAFRCKAGTSSHPFYLAGVLAEGDELLVFARTYDYDQVPDDSYLKDKYQAYLLFESEFMKVGDEYVNIKDTSWRTTVEEVRAAAAPTPAWTPTSVPIDENALFLVEKGYKWGFIDRSGAWVIEPQLLSPARPQPITRGSIGLVGREPPMFAEGLAAVGMAKPGASKFGFLDESGAWAIEPKFENAGRFSDGLAPVAISTEDGRGFWGYIDKTGAWVIEPRFAVALPFVDGLAAAQGDPDVEQSDKWGYIDRTGAWSIEPQWDWVASFQEVGVAVVHTQNGAGLIDRTGRVLVAPRYAYMFDFSDGLAAVRIDDDSTTECYWGYIDLKGREVVEPKCSVALPLSNGLGMVRTEERGDETYVDTTGKPAFEGGFHSALSFSEGLAAVVVSDGERQAGYIDTTGRMVIAPQLNVAGPFHDGLAVAGYTVDPSGGPYARNNLGFIDRSGAWVIEPRFFLAEPFENGLAWVREGDLEGYIDLQGNWVYSQPWEVPRPGPI